MRAGKVGVSRSSAFLLPSRRRFLRGLAGAPLVLTLAACASKTVRPEKSTVALPLPDRDELTAFLVSGRFAVRHGEHSASGSFSWRRAPEWRGAPDGVGGAGYGTVPEEQDQVFFYTPLGQTVAELLMTPQGSTLTADGRSESAVNPDVLVQRALGLELPLSGGADWLLARGGEVLSRDTAGRPQRIAARGWRLDYSYPDGRAGALPERVVAVRLADDVEVRLKLDEWEALGLDALTGNQP